MLHRAGALCRLCATAYYLRCRERRPLDEKAILFESMLGHEFSGNPFWLFKAIAAEPAFAGWRLAVSVTPGAWKKVRAALRPFGGRVRVVVKGSRAYFRALATSKFLVNDVSFPAWFVKREGQRYLNTWHGTPLKHMGRHMAHGAGGIGNVVRTFLQSDLLVHPNRYTAETMSKAYGMGGLFTGTAALAGYPRNAAFFDEARRAELRKREGLEGRRVAVYMPTWREEEARPGATSPLPDILTALDAALPAGVVLFAKLHHLAAKTFAIDFAKFKRIRPFPDGVDIYEFLNVADVLVTDYSSVMFDFACTGRPIVLLPYDKEQYLAARGMYIPYEELPFPVARSAQELAEMLGRALPDGGYEAFRAEYCPKDGPDAAAKLAKAFLSDDYSALEAVPNFGVGRGGVCSLLFAGTLEDEAAEKALLDYVQDASPRERLVVCLSQTEGRVHDDVVRQLPENVAFMTFFDEPGCSLGERVCWAIYKMLRRRARRVPAFLARAVERIYRREIERNFPTLRVARAVYFEGTGFREERLGAALGVPGTAVGKTNDGEVAR